MSYTNSTTHYGLPLPLGTDLTVPMDYNQAMNDIDEHLFDAETDASTAATAAANAVETANDAAADVADLGTTVNAHSGRLTSLEQHDIVQDNKIDAAETAIDNKFDSVGIADAYINGLTYNVGDIVTYNGQRFKCITAVTAAEPFDSDKWQGEDVQTVFDKMTNCWIIEEESHGEVLATGDGVKTVAQLLTEALTAFRSMTIEANHGIKVTNLIVPYTSSSRATLFANETLRTSIGATSGLYGSAIDTISSGIAVRRASFSQGNFYGIELTDNTVNFVNYNSVVPNSGQQLSIVYDVYKQL